MTSIFLCVQELANRPDVVRLVDCNKRAPEPKYKYDENVLGNVIAEYRQITTGQLREFRKAENLLLLVLFNGVVDTYRLAEVITTSLFLVFILTKYLEAGKKS
jgi:hypothetical protein